MERDAHEPEHPAREVQERAVLLDLHGVSGSMRGDGRQPDLAVLGGHERSWGAVRVSGHVHVGLHAELLKAHSIIFLLRR